MVLEHAGMNDYISKPIRMDDLEQVIRTNLVEQVAT